jgi:hypothetical protein
MLAVVVGRVCKNNKGCVALGLAVVDMSKNWVAADEAMYGFGMCIFFDGRVL